MCEPKGEWADDVVSAILVQELPEVKKGLEEQPGDHRFVQDPSSTLFYITQEKEQIMTKQVQLANSLL